MKCPICNSTELKPYKQFICCYGCGELLDSKGHAQCESCGEHDMSVCHSPMGDVNLCDVCYAQEEKLADFPRGYYLSK